MEDRAQYGTGCVRIRGEKWYGFYNVPAPDAPRGIRQKSVVLGPVKQDGRTVSEAQARKMLAPLMVSNRGLKQDGRVTFEQFTRAQWLPWKEGEWRSSTKRTNLEIIEGIILPYFGPMSLEKIDDLTIKSWIVSLAKERSASAVRHCLNFLRAILARAVAKGFIKANPAMEVSLKNITLKAICKDVITQQQFFNLCKAVENLPMEKALLGFVALTAVRPSELFAFRWMDLDAEKGVIHIRQTWYKGQLRAYSKTKDEAEALALDAVVIGPLLEWRSVAKFSADADLIFPDSCGTCIRPENYLRRTLKPLGRQAGIARLTFQCLRRTVATEGAEKGAGVKGLQGLLRHSKSETTLDVYAQKTAGSIKQTQKLLASTFGLAT
jgi:integrase